jgi:BCD family chlorophyll transporter-like MFS transporter
VPFIWYGTMLQFGGLAIMPFALLILAGDAENGPQWIGHVATALAFFLTAAGLQTTQTAGLALATDLASPASRPRVVSLMYVMLLVGMVGSGLVFSWLLRDFTGTQLVQVIQGAAVATVILNGIALWKQEARDPSRTRGEKAPPFREIWARFTANRRARRYLWALGLGTAAFNMQDIVLEPYGGEILGLPVSATTLLTAQLALGSLAALGVAARFLIRGTDPVRLAAVGATIGLFAFSAVIMASPIHSAVLFQVGATAIGFGGALFAVSMLIIAMDFDRLAGAGLALGAWGAVQATAAGLAIAAGGTLRDIVHHWAMAGSFGPALVDPAVGYSAVYHIELFLLFLTLIALGPLARRHRREEAPPVAFGLSELPG